MRLMSGRRLGVLTAGALALGLMIGLVQAGAQGSPTVLKFASPPAVVTAVGFNGNSNTPPPVGASIVVTIHLTNAVAQFGKSSGATVGRVLIQCTVLALNSQFGDGICSGIVHVPNGYITFGGNGAFSNAPVDYYAITGGVGPYASDRGEIVVTNHKNGSSSAVVTLSS